MRFCIVAVLALGFLVVADAQDDAAKEKMKKAIKEEIKKLEGTWVRISSEADGEKTEDAKTPPKKPIRLTITEDKFTTNSAAGDSVSTFKLDPTKKPKQLDLTSVEKNSEGERSTSLCIYKVDGDELTVCSWFPFMEKSDKLQKRPTEFAAKRGSDNVIEVYKREKKKE